MIYLDNLRSNIDEIFMLAALAIAGVAVLPSIILDVSVTTVSTFSPLNFSRSNQVDNTASSADVCVQL
ncbi:hypothetical protein CDG76_15120 [Nostoc sp. 'Peltigera membranacea cyanobiont' 210A]|nr:hypothetical protein CDG76_15120 [Nostoc sp. 'Peltigera membranacea cyanobiont' 210A]